jgi:hypothetical protein
MRDLKKLLERISESLNKDDLIKERVIDVVKSKTKVTLKIQEVSVKNGVLEINTKPAAKNEIKLKESELIPELALRGVYVSRVLYK